jgi:hypothetical protein
VSEAWLRALRTYALASGMLHLAWEVVQLPLYTLWREASLGAKAYAVLHCTAGDALIALAALAVALVVAGSARWPAERFLAVAAVALVGGLAYTVYSEWLNVRIRGAWSYSALMPLVPPFGTGLAPLAQWLVVPAAALALVRRRSADEPNARERVAHGSVSLERMTE